MRVRGGKKWNIIEFFTDYGDIKRYKVLEIIGEGSYGVVCAAIDKHDGEKVAIKKIRDIYATDPIRILREIRLLRLLRHPNIVKIKNVLVPPSKHDFKEIYVVFEFMESDLHQVIKNNPDLTHDHHRVFLYQMLRALKYMHTANVHHRDLKPNNILVNSNSKLKICDLGLARVSFNDSPTVVHWTDHVAARWYMAPELCGSFFAKYTPAIDIWSTGCIFAEVLTKKPLFPGRNTTEQLNLITDLLGTPSADVISGIQNDKARKFLTDMRKKPPVSFAEKFPNSDPLAICLLKRLLAFDPKDRPTAEQALADPYFRGISKIEREPSSEPISWSDFAFEGHNMAKEEITELIYREILEFHPQQLKDYLSRQEGANSLYPSDMGPSKRQCVYLEENDGKSGAVTPPARRHISLSWPTDNSSTVPPKPIQDMATVGHRGMTEEPHDNDSRVMEATSQNLPNALRPPTYVPTGRSAGSVSLYENRGKNATGTKFQNEAPRSISPRYASGSSMVVNQDTSATDSKRGSEAASSEVRSQADSSKARSQKAIPKACGKKRVIIKGRGRRY